MENKYQNSKIYSIKNTLNDEIYIGSTTVSLSQRMTKHRASLKCEKRGKCLLYQRMKELGVDNFYITLVEKYPCNDIEELRAKERGMDIKNWNIKSSCGWKKTRTI